MGKTLYFIFFPGSSSRAVPGAHAACLFSPAFIPSHKGPQQDPSQQNLALICRAGSRKKSPFGDAGKLGWQEEALWSKWPDLEQMKVDGEVAAGLALAPAGRELHNRMGLGMVLGLNWVKHVAVAVRSCLCCCAVVVWPQGRMKGWADKKYTGRWLRLVLGRNTFALASFPSCSSPRACCPRDSQLGGAAAGGAMRTASP